MEEDHASFLRSRGETEFKPQAQNRPRLGISLVLPWPLHPADISENQLMARPRRQRPAGVWEKPGSLYSSWGKVEVGSGR